MLRTFSALIVALLLTLTTTSAVQADKPDSLPDQASAKAALAAAKGLFRDGGNARPKERSGREATMVLRDLAVARHRLTGADRAAADAILARPTDGPTDPAGDGYTTASERLCSSDVCVHWVESTVDAMPLADSDTDGSPDYAETALTTLQEVHESYVSAGYREPRPDGTLGGDAKTDVYLAEVGDAQLYGYCTTDQQEWNPGGYDVWAYCVLDNDYSQAQFSTGTPIENLRVTAAHEYFHAVQYAYDLLEDAWLMEATATWAEDELFDDVNDNVNYLKAGPLGRPWTSLDLYDDFGHQYGSWVFFRYLTERMRTEAGGMPTLVRDIWRRADSTKGEAADYYSLQAIRWALKKRNADWTTTFTRFAEAGRRARQVYDEGRSQRYPNAPLRFRSITLSPTRPATNWGELRMDHLSSATARFVPSRSMTNRRWKIRLQVDMASRSRGSAAIATVHYRRKAPATRMLRLSRRGNGSTSVSFSRRSVKAVELTLVNASTRFTNCWSYTTGYSCGGAVPRDDAMKARLRARAYR